MYVMLSPVGAIGINTDIHMYGPSSLSLILSLLLKQLSFNLYVLLLYRMAAIKSLSFHHPYRVATVREKSLENEIFFQVREKTGNFNFSQGNFEKMIKVREKSGNLGIFPKM